MNPNRILVLYAHSAPHLSRVNRRLADAARMVDGVYVHELYEVYPDFYIDVAREHAMIAQAEVLVFLHPIHWYSAPALMHEWVDAVFADSWQKGPERSTARGKGYWLVTTTGNAAEDYAPGARHGRPFEDYLAPFAQTAAVCGMEWIAPLVLHGAHAVGAAAVDAHIAAFAARLRELAGAAPLPVNLNLASPDGT
jgi:glutathione-regulated potassium-efflux system ancillary protein KefF